ncbi:elongation factor P hydroxylase [Thalassolituus sp.]|uniref:elongation factor P hydroxylase n=1 Tax=Thalassolituus sp. TaxID=2030822 RepID=UPI0035112F1A
MASLAAKTQQTDAPLNVADLIRLFNHLFLSTENTRLVAGDSEPEYLPADDSCSYHRILFAHGFYESALHEISHWCIAGAERRLLRDFGYWYEPDGRSESRQREFEQVEVKPQALEWILSEACGRRFHISTDNLDGDPLAVEAGRARFRDAVHAQAHIYLQNGLPERAEILKSALLDYYQRHNEFGAHLFVPERI